jgi:hypothetical protein
MIDTATSGARCTLASPRLELVGFLAQRAKHLQMTNLVGGAPSNFLFHRSDITVSLREQPMSAMIFVVLLPMWRLSSYGQQRKATPYWRSCAAEEMKSDITGVSYAASKTLNLKPIHSKAIVSRLNLNLTGLCTMASHAAADCHFWQDAHRRMAAVIAHSARRLFWCQLEVVTLNTVTVLVRSVAYQPRCTWQNSMT